MDLTRFDTKVTVHHIFKHKSYKDEVFPTPKSYLAFSYAFLGNIYANFQRKGQQWWQTHRLGH